MENNYDYGETFESRIQDVRLDGPSMYTSILEKSDNSIDWGEANIFKLSYDKKRMILYLSDNGPNGFNKIDALHRFFKLGSKNDLINSKTIGKFGRGGYKAAMNISNSVLVESFIKGKKYSLSTDFIIMIENNSQNPTGDFNVIENAKNEIGSKFTLNIRPEYHNKFDTSIFIKNFIRAYHKFKDIKLEVDGKEYIPSVNCPYKDYINNKSYAILWNKDHNKFYAELYIEEQSDSESDSENEPEPETDYNINKCKIGTLNLYVLKNMITKNEYLGDNPGLDIYRNNRLCNTHNPLRNIGKIGENIKSGQMRGGRCHMEFSYENILLTDNSDVDECVGLTTNKEIPEDSSKFNESLLKIFEEKAKECSDMYENEWSERKNKHDKYLTDTLVKLKTLEKYNDDKLHLDTFDINSIYTNFQNFVNSQNWKINEEDMGYYYFKDKKEAKTSKLNGEDVFLEKKNSALYKKVPEIVNLSRKIISRKNKYKKYVDEINKKKEEYNVDFDIAEKIYNVLHNIEEIEVENEEYIDNQGISSDDCDIIINNYNQIKKLITTDIINNHFKDKLEEINNNIKEYEKIKGIKLIEEKKAYEKAKREADEKAKKEADAKAKREADAKAKREADAKAKREADAKAKREDDAKAKREDDETSKREADETAKREATATAKRNADKARKKDVTSHGINNDKVDLSNSDNDEKNIEEDILEKFKSFEGKKQNIIFKQIINNHKKLSETSKKDIIKIIDSSE